MDYKKFGAKIKELRLQKSLTQEQLAEKTGFSTVHISHIETGYTKPSLDAVIEICNALDTTPDFVLYGSLHKSGEHIKDEIGRLLKLCSDDELSLISHLIKGVIDWKS